MSILKVSQMGHPVLRRVAAPFHPEHIETEAFQRLVTDMEETMVAYQGAGLAGPQVHVANRILVYQSMGEDGEPEIQTLVNPTIEPESEEQESDWEGCLSIPGILGLVPRHARIHVTALDDEGEALDYIAQDFEARVIQHEVDHLDGILYFDRMENLSSLTYTTEHKLFWTAPEVDEEE
jgi:peptide deformylase